MVKITVMTSEEAYNFVVNIGLSRDQRSEHIIMTDPEYAYFYAKNIIKGRWLEAESVIMTDPDWWSWYEMYFYIND